VLDLAECFQVTVKGMWRSESTVPMRLALSRAADSDKAVEVVFERGAGIDLGVAALLLLLEGFCSQRGIQLSVVSHDPATWRLLGLCGLKSLAPVGAGR